MGFKPQDDLKCSEFACKGKQITTAEHNLYSNLVPALISWAKMRKKRALCSTLCFCNGCCWGVTASASLPKGLCLSFVLPPSAQPHQHSLVLSGWGFCSSSTVNIPWHWQAQCSFISDELQWFVSCPSRGRGAAGMGAAVLVKNTFIRRVS